MSFPKRVTASRCNLTRRTLTLALANAILDDQADYVLAQPGTAEKYPAVFPEHLCNPMTFALARIPATVADVADAAAQMNDSLDRAENAASDPVVIFDAGGA